MSRLVESYEWRSLKSHQWGMKDLTMRDLFAQDPDRFKKFNLQFEDILFDYSKHLITSTTMTSLFALARHCGLPHAIASMFSGLRINNTENRQVLHVALRNLSARPILVDGENIMSDELNRMRTFCDSVRSGEWKGYSGKPITHCVNIGIGGSDLGPKMVTEALLPYSSVLQLRFVSNVDGSHIGETLKTLNPETTLFLIASKTFTTPETMLNAESAKNWLLKHISATKAKLALEKHFIAISTNEPEVSKFGITTMFPIWDWVGGRFSLWSAIGLPIALSIGFSAFEELLQGANDVDMHFRKAPFESNIPVIMGLLGIWYNNFWGAHTHAVLPYDQYLEKLPSYLQQADMESNGKYVDKDGHRVNYSTGPVVWGEAGTNAQHSFFQLLHQVRNSPILATLHSEALKGRTYQQGTHLVPTDFLVAAEPINRSDGWKKHHDMLVSNCISQTEALMKGKTGDEVRAELIARGQTAPAIASILPYKIFTGNKPSSTFLYHRLTPRTLGRIISLYEHKIFVQGVIWNINSFDQWGVELGKQLTLNILPELQSDSRVTTHDSSTNGLIDHVKNLRAKL